MKCHNKLHRKSKNKLHFGEKKVLNSMGKSHFNSYIDSYALQWITYIFQIFLNTCEQDYTEIIYKYLKDTYCDF